MDNVLYNEIITFLSYFRLNANDVSLIEETELGFSVISVSISPRVYRGENKEEFLQAFSFVLKNIIKKYAPNDVYVIDINGETLQEIAYAKEITSIASKRVLQFGKTYEFGRLSAFKRMLIHQLASHIPGVSTRSEGQGIERRLQMVKE